MLKEIKARKMCLVRGLKRKLENDLKMFTGCFKNKDKYTVSKVYVYVNSVRSWCECLELIFVVI